MSLNQNSTCRGCRENLGNQEAHMEEGGCLYIHEEENHEAAEDLHRLQLSPPPGVPASLSPPAFSAGGIAAAASSGSVGSVGFNASSSDYAASAAAVSAGDPSQRITKISDRALLGLSSLLATAVKLADSAAASSSACASACDSLASMYADVGHPISESIDRAIEQFANAANQAERETASCASASASLATAIKNAVS